MDRDVRSRLPASTRLPERVNDSGTSIAKISQGQKTPPAQCRTTIPVAHLSISVPAASHMAFEPFRTRRAREAAGNLRAKTSELNIAQDRVSMPSDQQVPTRAPFRVTAPPPSFSAPPRKRVGGKAGLQQRSRRAYAWIRIRIGIIEDRCTGNILLGSGN